MDIFRETFNFDRHIYHDPLDIPSFSVPSTKSENWNDHFDKGLRHLKENNLILAEQSMSQALKILSELQNASHVNIDKARCFHSMAEIYLNRASQQSDVLDVFCEMMVKSIALLEAERIYKYGSYKQDKDIDTAIVEAELKFIDKVFGSSGVGRFKKTNDGSEQRRQKLGEIRSRISDEYFPSLATVNDWCSDDETERCEETERIYNKIHDDMKSFLVEIFLYCGQIAGPAPCKFSIIGLGSMSRKEVTPYSDLEFAILVDNNNNSPSPADRQYFRFLTYLIQMQIIRLGETILPSVGISSLNDFYSKNTEDDWFYDAVIPKGFSFDGMMPWASKTPLGRKEWRGESRQEYIRTVNEMLELQNVTPDSSIESLKTANVFSSVCHLFGDESLTKTYEQKLSASLTDANRIKSFQAQVLKVMQNLLDTYRPEELTLKDSGSQQDVKKEVYRLTSILVEQLSNFFGIFGQSSWQCIKEMSKREILTKDGAKNLLVALSITTELRLKCYHTQGRQKEALPTVPQLSFCDEKYTPCPVTTAIVRLYQSLIPLKLVVHQIVEIMKKRDSIDPEQLVVSVVQQMIFFDTSPKLTAVAYLRLLQLPKAFACLLSTDVEEMENAEKAEVLLVLAFCYHLVGKFQEAIKCCREVQILYTATPGIVTKGDLLIALSLMMDVYIDQGLYQEAVQMHEQIAKLEDGEDLDEKFLERKLDVLNSSAVLFMRMKKYNKAEQILRNLIKKLPKIQKHYFNYFMYLNNLAVILLNQDRLTETKSILENALKLAHELYGANAVHPYLARCLTNLAEVHYFLRNLKEADHFVQLALIIYSHVHENQLIEPSVVDALVIKARIHQCYERWDDMLSCLNKAKDVVEILYEGQPHHNVGKVLYYLGCCEQERGRFSEAMSYYQEFLKNNENKRRESQQAGAGCDNACALVRIANVAAHCSCDASYRQSCLEKALEIEEQIHGKESNHGHLAICFGSLGYWLITENRVPDGLDYLEKAMQIFEEINLDQSRSYGLAQMTIGKILGENSPYKAEKHLRTAKAVLNKTLNDESHGVLLQVNSSLLKIFQQTNRIQDGFELAEEQQKLIDPMFSKCYSPTSRQLRQVFFLGEFYETNGRRTTAKEIYSDLMKFLEEHVHPTDLDENLLLLLWLTQQRVGEIYQADGMFEEAGAMFQRTALSIQETPSQRPFVRETHHLTLWYQAALFMETKRFSQAHEKLDVLISSYEKDPESIDANTAASAFFTRGELNRRCLRFGLALVYLEKALKLAERLRGTVTYNVTLTKATEFLYGKIMNAIGLVYEQTSNVKRALECYLCCLNSAECMPLTLDTATFHQNAADSFKKLGQLDKALEHYKKSLEIRERLHSEDPVREDIATVLYHIAIIQITNQRPREASEILNKLVPLRKELLKKSGSLQNYCATFILKGNCHIMQSGEAREAKEAYEEAEKVLKCMTEGEPNEDYAVTVSNIGYACILLKEWDQAISQLQKALRLKRILYPEKQTQEVGNALRILATAHLGHQEYQKALHYFQEALEIFEIRQSPDDETECVLKMAECYKGLKSHDIALDLLRKVEELCVKKPLSEEMQLITHNEMADIYSENEYKDKSKVLHHLKIAESILKRKLKQSVAHEEALNEVQGKILSLENS